MAARFCVVYRTGGTENFQWHRSLAMSEERAYRVRAQVERQGRPAMVVDYDLSVSIGLPETYEA